MNFSLQHNRVSNIISSDVEGIHFQKIYFEKNQIIPSKGSCEFLQNIRKIIQESIELYKYQIIRVQIIVSAEEKNNTFLTYERIQYLYDFFEQEMSRDQIESNIQFEIIENANVKKSYMQFRLLENE